MFSLTKSSTRDRRCSTELTACQETEDIAWSSQITSTKRQKAQTLPAVVSSSSTAEELTLAGKVGASRALRANDISVELAQRCFHCILVVPLVIVKQKRLGQED